MQLFNNYKASTEIKIKAALLLLAVSLNALEFFFPRIPLFPWLKPGIANIVTIIVILKYGFKEAILFSLLRIWIVSFYFGFSFLTTTLALSGSFLAITVMSIGKTFSLTTKGKTLGFVGISILGAISHNLGQLTGVYFILSKNHYLFFQLPFMLFVSVISGSINGFLASFLYESIDKISSEENMGNADNFYDNRTLSGKMYRNTSIMLFLFCSSLLFVKSITILTGLAVFVIGFVQMILKFNLQPLLLPFKRFWLIFVAVACMNLFFSYGTVVPQIPILTFEGIKETAIQWIRIFTWLQVTYLFLHFNTHLYIFHILKNKFPNNGTMLAAGIESVEYFPIVLDMMRKKTWHYLKLIVSKPKIAVQELLMMMIDVMDEKL